MIAILTKAVTAIIVAVQTGSALGKSLIDPTSKERSRMVVSVQDDKTAARELYKMEYERCAQRYNDIYNAVWTNFSYMAIVAGGILAFGGERLPQALTVCLACIPLLFWYWATFEPLNRYGDKILLRLEELEKVINKAYQNHFHLDSTAKLRPGLHHYSDFDPANETASWMGDFFWRAFRQLWLKGLLQLRVREIVRIFASVVHIIAIGFFCYGGYQVRANGSLFTSKEPTKVEMAVPEIGKQNELMEKLFKENVETTSRLNALQEAIQKDIDARQRTLPASVGNQASEGERSRAGK